MHLLGYVLSEKVVSTSPENVKQYPVLKNVKGVRAFIGLTTFYRRPVPYFAEIAKPLIAPTRKDRQFTWGPQQQKAVQSMKDRLCTTPVLAYPNFDLPLILITDATKVAIAAKLSQVQDGKERPVAYVISQLITAEEAYIFSKQEMLALVWATKYFRSYLYGKKFLVSTDHAALFYLRIFADKKAACRDAL